MSGRGPHGDAPELATRVNVVNVTLEPIGPACVDARERLSMKSRRALVKQASEDFREAVSQRLLPALRAFDADLIFLSAGFDGHADDFYYFLTEDDYHWITSEVVAIADAYVMCFKSVTSEKKDDIHDIQNDVDAVKVE